MNAVCIEELLSKFSSVCLCYFAICGTDIKLLLGHDIVSMLYSYEP